MLRSEYVRQRQVLHRALDTILRKVAGTRYGQ
mgnify:CR=1 FL=1|jgi:hypothetical protein